MEFYWLHCDGPDGGVVMLAEYNSRTDTYFLIEDGRYEQRLEGDRLHKWTLLKRVKVVRPHFERPNNKEES